MKVRLNNLSSIQTGNLRNICIHKCLQECILPYSHDKQTAVSSARTSTIYQKYTVNLSVHFPLLIDGSSSVSAYIIYICDYFALISKCCMCDSRKKLPIIVFFTLLSTAVEIDFGYCFMTYMVTEIHLFYNAYEKNKHTCSLFWNIQITCSFITSKPRHLKGTTLFSVTGLHLFLFSTKYSIVLNCR